jgi:hypothetical protein
VSLLHGYDISAYQSATAPAADFVFVKATEGKGYRSSKFAAQWASAKSKAKHRGVYHFARPEESSYSDQAARFLDVVQPSAGESLWLDLEASKLTQSETNAWARGWGDYIRDHAPGATSGVYLGAGYATNGTGRGLSSHFGFWWYPQYPSLYQVIPGDDVEEARAANRSSTTPGRFAISAKTTAWPAAVTPWLPSGLTVGWKAPHIWQFTDNHSGLDANVTGLTVAELAGGTPSKPPAPAPKHWSGRYLKAASPMMHGSDVTWVQKQLNAHGASPKLTTDGYYGAKTQTAVKTFQRAHKLTADGIVGPKTWAALAK